MKQAKRVSTEILQHAAQHGVERAIAARKAAGVELSANELNAVGGGVGGLIAGWEIRGGRLLDQIVAPQVNQGLETVGRAELGAGALGATLPGAAIGAGQVLGA